MEFPEPSPAAKSLISNIKEGHILHGGVLRDLATYPDDSVIFMVSNKPFEIAYVKSKPSEGLDQSKIPETTIYNTILDLFRTVDVARLAQAGGPLGAAKAALSKLKSDYTIFSSDMVRTEDGWLFPFCQTDAVETGNEILIDSFKAYIFVYNDGRTRYLEQQDFAKSLLGLI